MQRLLTIVSTLAVAAVGLYLGLWRQHSAPAPQAAGWTRLIVGRPSGAPSPTDPQAPPDSQPPLLDAREQLPRPTLSGAASAQATDLAAERPAVFEVTVRPGDTLGELCQGFYGTARPALVAALARFNGLSGPDRIRAGQVLLLPPVEDLE